MLVVLKVVLLGSFNPVYRENRRILLKRPKIRNCPLSKIVQYFTWSKGYWCCLLRVKQDQELLLRITCRLSSWGISTIDLVKDQLSGALNRLRTVRTVSTKETKAEKDQSFW